MKGSMWRCLAPQQALALVQPPPRAAPATSFARSPPAAACSAAGAADAGCAASEAAGCAASEGVGCAASVAAAAAQPSAWPGEPAPGVVRLHGPHTGPVSEHKLPPAAAATSWAHWLLGYVASLGHTSHAAGHQDAAGSTRTALPPASRHAVLRVALHTAAEAAAAPTGLPAAASAPLATAGPPPVG